MGTWGIGSFENDYARDWAGDIEELGEGDIDMALDHLIEHARPEAAACFEALAAAEVVAALAGRPGELPDNVKAWGAQRKPATPELLRKARIAVHKVLGESKLFNLWEEPGDRAAWHRNVEELQKRLA